MISKGDYIVIHDLYKKGKSIREIARLLKVDRRTVSKYLKQTKHDKTTRLVAPSILEPYKGYIREFIGKSKHRIPYSVILDDIRELGYPGSRSILQEFLTTEYSNLKLVHDPVVRFETKPGEQMQVDWTTLRFGKEPIYGFVATMGYSRQTFVYFTDNMKAETLVKCHELAFLSFGGIPKTILYDNMKTIVDTRDAYGKGKHRFHGLMHDLSKRLGFQIKLCRPYRAKTKGKVERFNSYLKGNFYRSLVIKLEDAKLAVDVQTLNGHIHGWLAKANNRIHGTTKQKPSVLLAEEKKYLVPYLVQKQSISYITYPRPWPSVVVKKARLDDYDHLLSAEGSV